MSSSISDPSSCFQTNGASTHEPSPSDNLLLVSTSILQQAIDFVNDSLSSDEQLTFQSKYIPGSTIGKHLRHARDHFELLVDSLAAPPPHALSYDTRVRNRPMERSRPAAREALQASIERLTRAVPAARLDAPVALHAVTPHAQVFGSTFGRELWFAVLHAVHHWSMVRVIAGEMNLTIEDSFGFAPSTLVHRGHDGLPGKSKI